MGMYRLAENELRGAPRRIQRKRSKGWTLPRDTICVTRPGTHGNPFFPGCGRGFGNIADGELVSWPLRTDEDAVRHFREEMRLMRRDRPAHYEAYIAPLRGKNLACWCREGKACHGDILLVLANQPMPKAEAA